MKKWLKCDFHIHTNEDPEDNVKHLTIKYSPKELIDIMASMNFDVISISHHDDRRHNDELLNYAKSRGILLVSAIEKTIEKKHVLIINAPDNLENIKKLSDLKTIPKNILIVAAHPFYWLFRSLKKNLLKYKDSFDAVEYTSMYFFFFNRFNKKAEVFCKKYGKPMIGNSDGHYLFQLGQTYSLIYAEPNFDSIREAIKNGNIEIKTSPIPFLFPISSVIFEKTRMLIKRALKMFF